MVCSVSRVCVLLCLQGSCGKVESGPVRAEDSSAVALQFASCMRVTYVQLVYVCVC